MLSLEPGTLIRLLTMIRLSTHWPKHAWCAHVSELGLCLKPPYSTAPCPACTRLHMPALRRDTAYDGWCMPDPVVSMCSLRTLLLHSLATSAMLGVTGLKKHTQLLSNVCVAAGSFMVIALRTILLLAWLREPLPGSLEFQEGRFQSVLLVASGAQTQVPQPQ